MNVKRIIYGIGILSVAVAPVAIVVSCGKKSQPVISKSFTPEEKEKLRSDLSDLFTSAQVDGAVVDLTEAVNQSEYLLKVALTQEEVDKAFEYANKQILAAQKKYAKLTADNILRTKEYQEFTPPSYIYVTPYSTFLDQLQAAKSKEEIDKTVANYHQRLFETTKEFAKTDLTRIKDYKLATEADLNSVVQKEVAAINSINNIVDLSSEYIKANAELLQVEATAAKSKIVTLINGLTKIDDAQKQHYITFFSDRLDKSTSLDDLHTNYQVAIYRSTFEGQKLLHDAIVAFEDKLDELSIDYEQYLDMFWQGYNIAVATTNDEAGVQDFVSKTNAIILDFHKKFELGRLGIAIDALSFEATAATRIKTETTDAINSATTNEELKNAMAQFAVKVLQQQKVEAQVKIERLAKASTLGANIVDPLKEKAIADIIKAPSHYAIDMVVIDFQYDINS